MGQIIYEELGGVRKGKNYFFAFNATWPLAKIRVFDDKILIKIFLLKDVFLLKDEINYIQKYHSFLGFLGGGIRIFHKKQENPFLVFWSFSLNKLIRNIKKAGYVVKE